MGSLHLCRQRNAWRSWCTADVSRRSRLGRVAIVEVEQAAQPRILLDLAGGTALGDAFVREEITNVLTLMITLSVVVFEILSDNVLAWLVVPVWVVCLGWHVKSKAAMLAALQGRKRLARPGLVGGTVGVGRVGRGVWVCRATHTGLPIKPRLHDPPADHTGRATQPA